MLTARPEPVRDPQQAIEAWVQLVHRLAALGVGVQLTNRPMHPVGTWDSVTRMLLIRSDIELGDQVWALQQAWNYLAIGPDASPTARRVPLLSLVPTQREASDAAIA